MSARLATLGILLVSLVAAGASSAADPRFPQRDYDAAQQAFERALEARADGRPFEALGILRRLNEDYPELRRPKLELALTLYQTLQYAQARRVAQRVLDAPDTPEGVKLTLRELIARIDADAEPHGFSGALSLGPFYDSNVNIGPASEALDPLTLLLGDTGPREDFALNVDASLAHRYLFPDTVDIGPVTAAAAWLSDVRWFRNDYLDEHDYDLNILSARTGPALIVAGLGRLSANAQTMRIDLGDDPLAWFTSGELEATWFRERGELTLGTLIEARDYQDANDPRDSTYRSATAAMSYALGETITAQGRVELFDEDADVGRFGNSGQEVALGAVFQAWPSGTVSAELSRRWTEHDAPEPALALAGAGQTRDETYSRASLAASQDLGFWRPGDSVLSAYATLSRNRSNIGRFEFERLQVGVSLRGSFD